MLQLFSTKSWSTRCYISPYNSVVFRYPGCRTPVVPVIPAGTVVVRMARMPGDYHRVNVWCAAGVSIRTNTVHHVHCRSRCLTARLRLVTTHVYRPYSGLWLLLTCRSRRLLFENHRVCRRCFQMDEVQQAFTKLRQNRSPVVRLMSTSTSIAVQRSVNRRHSCRASEVRSRYGYLHRF